MNFNFFHQLYPEFTCNLESQCPVFEVDLFSLGKGWVIWETSYEKDAARESLDFIKNENCRKIVTTTDWKQWPKQHRKIFTFANTPRRPSTPWKSFTEIPEKSSSNQEPFDHKKPASISHTDSKDEHHFLRSPVEWTWENTNMLLPLKKFNSSFPWNM